MTSRRGFFLVSLLGAATVGTTAAGCQSSSPCTPFAAPSITASSAMCAAPSSTPTPTPTPTPTRVVTLGSMEPGGGDTPARMTVDDAAIYFTANPPGPPVPSLYRVPKSGGELQLLDNGVTAPVLVSGASLLYTRMTAHPQSGGFGMDYPNVVRLGDTCSLEALPNAGLGGDEEGGPVVDGKGGVSWTMPTSGGKQILHWEPSTDTTSPIGPVLPVSTATLVGDAESLYWWDDGEGTGATTISTMPSAGGTIRVVATLPGPMVIADEDADALYVATDPIATLPQSTPVVLERLSKTDGSVTNTLTTDPSAPSFALPNPVFTAHDTNVYWTEGGRVLRTPKSGGAYEVVADFSAVATAIEGIGFDACTLYVNGAALDGTYAIWSQGLPTGAGNDDAPDAAAPLDAGADADAADDAAADDAGTPRVTVGPPSTQADRFAH